MSRFDDEASLKHFDCVMSHLFWESPSGRLNDRYFTYVKRGHGEFLCTLTICELEMFALFVELSEGIEND